MLISYTESIPKPGDGEVLIQVHYSTINPIDTVLFNIQKTEGFSMGSDGTGIIVEVGNGVGDDLKGRKVSFLGGAWSELKIEKVQNLLLLD